MIRCAPHDHWRTALLPGGLRAWQLRWLLVTVICVLGMLQSLAIAATPIPATTAAPNLPQCRTPVASEDLSARLSTWEDADGAATLTEARQHWQAGQFTRVAGPPAAIGFVPGALWVHVSIAPPEADCLGLLVLRQPRITRVEIFDAVGASAEPMARMGAGLPFGVRALPHRFPNARITRLAGQNTELLLRVQSLGSVQLPLELHAEANFYPALAAEPIWTGMFHGLVLVLIVLNLALGITLRDGTYGAVVAYLLAIMLFSLSMTGTGTQLLWPNAPQWQQLSQPISSALMIASVLVVVAKFLELARTRPRLAQVMMGLATAQLLVGAAALFAPPQLVMRLLVFGACITVLLVTGVAVRHIFHGTRAAQILLASWILLLLVALLLVLSGVGIITRRPSIEYAAQAVAAMQVLVLSYALLQRSYQERSERVALQRKSEREAHQARLEEGLRASLAERNIILDNAVVGIVLLNPEGRVVWANRAMYEQFRVPAGSGLGQSLESYYTSRAAYLEVGRTVKAAVARGESFVGEYQLRRFDGSLFWASISGRAINPNEVSRGTVWSVLDISDRKRAEDDTRLALAHQQELNVMKTRFVSMASHEFRTPLTAIQSSAELLHHYAERMPADERAVILDQIETAVARMTRMLEDVLVLGRGDGSTAPFQPRPLDVPAWCGRLVQDVTLATASSGSVRPEVVLDIAPEIGRCVVDAILLEHILSNLVSNAIKYSPQGGTVRVHMRRQGPLLRIEVSDQGIGIREQDQFRLFEAFYRASNVGEIPGTGLGLTVVQRAVQRHGGTITLDSAPGEGTRFVVEIPAIPVTEGAPPSGPGSVLPDFAHSDAPGLPATSVDDPSSPQPPPVAPMPPVPPGQ